MAGTKRTWDGQHLPMHTMTATATQSQTMQITSIFETFRNELDEHHDRRERLIKISRDVTALSKKIIFTLQRIRKLKSPLPPTIEKETNNRLSQITALFASAVPDTTGPNAWRYQRQLSGAVQEFIEALSFSHYLRTQTLISLEEVRGALPGILVTGEDYVMGLFDLTGEIMRFAVTLLSSSILTEGGGEGEKGEKGVRGLDEERAGIVVDLREMRSLFEALTVRYGMRELGKKIEVMQGSVEKVERAAYGILVRGSERPTGWMPELE